MTKGLFLSAEFVGRCLEDSKRRDKIISVLKIISQSGAIVFLSDNYATFFNAWQNVDLKFKKQMVHVFKGKLTVMDLNMIFDAYPDLIITDTLFVTDTLNQVDAAKKIGMPYFIISKPRLVNGLSQADFVTIEELGDLVQCL